MLPGREAFVDSILAQTEIRCFLTHLDLLMLFQNTIEDIFFIERVWDAVLKHHTGTVPNM